MPDEYFTDDWHDPRRCTNGEEQISDEEFREQYIVGPRTPTQHVERIREIEKLGATVVCLQNASGADPGAALKVYGERVLPALRGRRLTIGLEIERQDIISLEVVPAGPLARWCADSIGGTTSGRCTVARRT